MIRSTPAAWRTNMQTMSNEDRVHIDFRGIDYPDIGSGSPTFTLGREDNLIDRGNHESATKPGILGETGSANNCTWVQSSAEAHGGDYSFLMTKTSAAGAGIAQARFTDNILVADMHGIVPGEVVELSTWVYIPSAGGPDADEVRAVILYYDSGAWVTSNYTLATTQDAWEKLSVSVTVPTTATGFRAYITINTEAAVDEYIYTDDAILKRHSVPGSHYLSGGYSEHLVELADTGTIQIKFKPNFAYNIGSTVNVFGWRVSATQEFRCYYNNATDKFSVTWEDGGTARGLISAQYDDGSAQRNINQWIILTLAYDISDTSNTGSSLWMNKTQDDTTFGTTTKDAKSTTFNKMQIRAYNGAAGDIDAAYYLYIPDYIATDADVQNDFKNVKDEQIYFPLDGHSTGKTRCNVSEFLTDLSTEKGTRASNSGNYGANRADIELKSLSGEFADDQYAAFDPANSVYNGTSSQAYLQNRCRVWIENWYNGDFDYVLVGRTDDSMFRRSTPHDGISFATISVDDHVADLAKKRIENSKAWQDKDFCDSTESNSLIHLITRMQSEKEVRNYCHNSGFENNPLDTWTESDLSSFTRDVGEHLFGTASGKMVYDNVAGGTQFIRLQISFDNDIKLNVGETWTFSYYLKCADACGAHSIVYEYAGAVAKASILAYWELLGGEDWVRFEMTHTIEDKDSDELRIHIDMNDNVTLYVDGCALNPGNRAPTLYVDNTAATGDADDYATGEYDTIGFDCDAVDISHPWKRIEEGSTVWNSLTELAAAAIPNYFGMNEAGTLELRAMLTNITTNTYTDPIAEEDIGEQDIMTDVGTFMRPKANRIIVRGSGYAEYTNKTCIWRATEMGNFDQGVDGRLNETVADGDKWPDPDEYEDFYAYYSRRYKRESWQDKVQ